MANTKVSLKLLVDTKTHRVLFAEAGKDFVDFLFHILSLPVGTVVKLLRKEGMVGCLGNLYQSIESLNDDYIQPYLSKDCVLQPKVTTTGVNCPLLLGGAQGGSSRKFYGCPSTGSYGGSCNIYVANVNRANCPSCNRSMTKEMNYVAPSAAGSNQVASSTDAVASSDGGYVKGVVTYMVMDNLVITPMSSISGIALLNKFNVKDLGSLSEQVVEVDVNKAVALLKASLHSQTVLTSVFLAKKA